jgi:hypothetical protein
MTICFFFFKQESINVNICLEKNFYDKIKKLLIARSQLLKGQFLCKGKEQFVKNKTSPNFLFFGGKLTENYKI